MKTKIEREKILEKIMDLVVYMEKIIILDFGSQVTQVIGRRVRELNVYCEILPFNKFPFEDTLKKTIPADI